MATEAVSSYHSTAPEQVEKAMHEEVKTMEESVPQPKGNEERPKAEQVPSGTAPSAESEEKVKEKESEPSLVEEVVKAKVEEKPKAEEPIVVITSAEPEEKIEDKKTEPPPTEGVKKPDDIPIMDVPLTGNAEVSEDPVPQVVKSEPKEQPEIKDVEKPQEECTKIAVEEKLEEQPKEIEIPKSAAETVQTKPERSAELPEKVEIPESTTETVEVKELLKKIEIPESVIAESKEVQAEELPPKEPETDVVKDLEVLAAEDKKEKAPVPVPKVEDKPEEKPEITVQTKDISAVAETTEKLEVDTTKDKEIPTYEIKDTKVAEEVPVVEPVASESSDQVTSTPEELHIVGKDVEVPPPVEVVEKTGVKDTAKEVVAKADAVEPIKIEEKIGKENEEANEEKTAVAKELNQPESKGVEDVPSTISEEAGKIIEVTSREIELPAENGSKKDETLASDETTKVVEVEKNVDVQVPQKAETETKGEEAAEAAEPKLEQQEKEVKEPATTDAPIEEPTKETDDLKTVQESPKKQSNTLLAKVKQSLVKAKKVITGKSQSKPPPSETKDEIKAT